MIVNPNAPKWNVVIIDDEPDSLEIVCRILSFHGANVLPLSAGRKALEALEVLRPNLILMDLSMPEMDGWELLYRLRNNPRLKNVPIVALTAHAMKGDRERALDAGFNHYLTKPLTPSTFFDELHALLFPEDTARAAAPRSGNGNGNGASVSGSVKDGPHE